MKFLSWNYRGFSSSLKVESLRDLIKLDKSSVILLQETKMEEYVALLSGKKPMQNGKGIAKSLVGASGGIMTPWDPLQWELEVSFYANH
jgi:hypothetical protein